MKELIPNAFKDIESDLSTIKSCIESLQLLPFRGMTPIEIENQEAYILPTLERTRQKLRSRKTFTDEIKGRLRRALHTSDRSRTARMLSQILHWMYANRRDFPPLSPEFRNLIRQFRKRGGQSLRMCEMIMEPLFLEFNVMRGQ